MATGTAYFHLLVLTLSTFLKFLCSGPTALYWHYTNFKGGTLFVSGYKIALIAGVMPLSLNFFSSQDFVVRCHYYTQEVLKKSFSARTHQWTVLQELGECWNFSLICRIEQTTFQQTTTSNQKRHWKKLLKGIAGIKQEKIKHNLWRDDVKEKRRLVDTSSITWQSRIYIYHATVHIPSLWSQTNQICIIIVVNRV